MPRLKQTILILAAAAALLLPACSPSDDITLPAPGNTNITVTTPPKPAFSGDGAQTRFNQEIGRWEVGDVAEIRLYTKNSGGTENQNGGAITCVAVNTDGSAVWKIDNFPSDATEIAMDDYVFSYFGPDRYRITTDYIKTFKSSSYPKTYTPIERSFNFPLTDLEHDHSRFRLTGLQKGDYVIVDNYDFNPPYEPTGEEAIENIRFIAADDEDTYIYMATYSGTPVTITVARRGVTLSKTLDMDSEPGKAYSIDISTFKAFDGENPQDVTWIHNATELQDFANAVTGGNDYTNKIVRLACDIDCSSISNFPVIGSDSKQFNGTFDGNGYSIRNLKIAGNENSALFYNIGDIATVKNLTLENISVKGTSSASGFASFNSGTIDHCTVGGQVTITDGSSGTSSGFIDENQGTVTYCTVNNLFIEAGWIMGFTYINGGTMERCGVTGTTTLSGNHCYGFVYQNNAGSYIIGCYTDTKDANGHISFFYNSSGNCIVYSRTGIYKQITGSWDDDTGWYRTDTPEGVLKLYWEE